MHHNDQKTLSVPRLLCIFNQRFPLQLQLVLLYAFTYTRAFWRHGGQFPALTTFHTSTTYVLDAIFLLGQLPNQQTNFCSRAIKSENRRGSKKKNEVG